jgi:hypothetical protein
VKPLRVRIGRLSLLVPMAREIAEALRADSDGGRAITAAEAEEIGAEVGRAVAKAIAAGRNGERP